MRLTKRDLVLLDWINQFGFVNAKLVAQFLKVSLAVAYRRLRKLVQHQYLHHQSIYFGLPGVYQVTSLGVAVSQSVLPAPRSIRQASYHHDLAVTALSLVLCEQYQGSYVSERLLRHRAGSKGVGQFGHFCDGVLNKEGKQIAIEVELTKKGKQRREKILKHYLKSFDYEEVWYFCGNREVENQLRPFLKDLPFLKLHTLSDFIDTAWMA